MKYINWNNGLLVREDMFEYMYKGISDVSDKLRSAIFDIGSADKVIKGLEISYDTAIRISAGYGIVTTTGLVADGYEENLIIGFDSQQTVETGGLGDGTWYVTLDYAYVQSSVNKERYELVVSLATSATSTGFVLGSFLMTGGSISNMVDLRDLLDIDIESYNNTILDIETAIIPLSRTFLMNSGTSITEINVAVQSGNYSDFVLTEDITIADEILIEDVKDLRFTSLNNEKHEIEQTDNTKAVFNIVTTGSYSVENIEISSIALLSDSSNIAGSPIHGDCTTNGARNINVFNCDLNNVNAGGAYAIYTVGIEGVLLLNCRASGWVHINDSVGSMMINTNEMPSAVGTVTTQLTGQNLVNIGGDITGGVRNLRGDASYLVMDKLQIIEDLLVDGAAIFNNTSVFNNDVSLNSGFDTGTETFKFDTLTITGGSGSYAYTPPVGYEVYNFTQIGRNTAATTDWYSSVAYTFVANDHGTNPVEELYYDGTNFVYVREIGETPSFDHLRIFIVLRKL